MTKPTLLLEAHLKALRLPTFLREYDKVARHCAQEGLDCPRYLFRLCEAGVTRSRAARHRAPHQSRQAPGLEESRDLRVPRDPVGEQASGARADPLGISRPQRERVGVGQLRHGQDTSALALGLAACQKGYRVRFTTAAALVNELLEARDDKRLLRVQKQLAKQDLLIRRRARLRAVVEDRRRAAVRDLLPALRASIDAGDLESALQRMTEIFGSERLTGALLDRLTHHVHILELNGESYRLEHSKKARPPASRSGILTSPPTCRRQPRHSTAGWSSFPPPRWSTFAPPLTDGCRSGAETVRRVSWSGLTRTREVVPTGFRRTKLSPDVLTKYLRGDRSPSSRRLVERVTGTLEQHVYFEDPRLYTLVALWVIGTYLYSTFGHYGYLFLFSMLMRSGKTRVIEVLSHLAFEASAPLNAPTPASLRELASGGGTSLLDTLERWRDKNQESHSAAMDILDAGFRNGGVVTKMVTTKGSDWQREEYPVYAPYAMAAIGRHSLTDTARDRSFVIEMHRKPVALKTAKYTWHRCEEQCRPVRDDLYRWALRNAPDVAAINESLRLEPR